MVTLMCFVYLFRTSPPWHHKIDKVVGMLSHRAWCHSFIHKPSSDTAKVYGSRKRINFLENYVCLVALPKFKRNLFREPILLWCFHNSDLAMGCGFSADSDKIVREADFQSTVNSFVSGQSGHRVSEIWIPNFYFVLMHNQSRSNIHFPWGLINYLFF